MSKTDGMSGNGENPELERLEVMGTPVLAQYDRLMSILGMELTESQLGLLAKPKLNDEGQPIGWHGRNGATLKPVSSLSDEERTALEERRDRILKHLDAVIGRLRARGAPGMVTAQVLATALILPDDRETLHTDGDGPVLIDWGSRVLGSVPADDEAIAVEPVPSPATQQSSAGLTIKSVEPVALPEEVSIPQEAPEEAPQRSEPLPPVAEPETGPAPRVTLESEFSVPDVQPSEPRASLRLRPASEDLDLRDEGENLVAERDDVFRRKQFAEQAERVSRAKERAARKKAELPRRLEDDGNPLVWLLPAMLLGFGTFFLFRSPDPESLVAKVLSEESAAKVAAVIDQLLTPRYGRDLEAEGPGSYAGEPDVETRATAPESDSKVITLLNEGSVSGVPVPSGRLTAQWSEHLAPCFMLPATGDDAVPVAVSVTLRLGIDDDGKLFFGPDLQAPEAVTDSIRPLYSAAIASVLACEPLPSATGPSALDITFGPTGVRSVKLVPRAGASTQ